MPEPKRKRPQVLLFDIGGVCVSQNLHTSIQRYEVPELKRRITCGIGRLTIPSHPGLRKVERHTFGLYQLDDIADESQWRVAEA